MHFYRSSTLLTVAFIILLVAGCGSGDYTPSEARDEIVNRGFEVEGDDYSRAIDSSNVELARIYAQAGIDDNELDFYPVVEAASKGNPEVLRALLEEGEEIPTTSKTHIEKVGALGHAAIEGNLESVDILLENGAEPSVQALFLSIREDRPTVLDHLLQAENSPSEKALQTSLQKAILARDSLSTSKLIEHGAEANPDTVFTETPIFLAACGGRWRPTYDLFEQLLFDYGADPSPIYEAKEIYERTSGRSRMSRLRAREEVQKVHDCAGRLISDDVENLLAKHRRETAASNSN